MARIIFVTGGCRSGKSAFAQKTAENYASPMVYVATAPVLDDEMALRIAKHQADRAGAGWRTVEETIDIAGTLRKIEEPVILVDCLTLWINNLMYEAELQDQDLTEASVAEACEKIVAVCNSRGGTVIFVTNEVGMGIVPENRASRSFRDFAGRCNQIMAAASDTAVWLISGLPVYLKGSAQDLP